MTAIFSQDRVVLDRAGRFVPISYFYQRVPGSQLLHPLTFRRGTVGSTFCNDNYRNA